MKKENFFCPICSGLSEEVVGDVLENSHIKSFNNQNIYLQNDSYEGIYVVSDGHVRLSSNNEEGNDIFVKALHEDNSFGESGIPDSKYLESAFSVGKSTCTFISKSQLEKLMSKHSALSLAVLSSMGRWLVDYHNRFMTLSLHSVRKRLEHYLNSEAKKADTNEIHFDLRKHEIASNLGIRPETLSRTLKELEGAGLIAQRNGCLDVSVLIAILNNS